MAVPFLEPLIAAIRSTFDLFLKSDPASLAQLEVVLSPLAHGDTDDLARPLGDDDLRLVSVALLLPAVVAPLFFCGRSTGLAAASTPTPSNGVSSAYSRLLPGTCKAGRVSSRCSI